MKIKVKLYNLSYSREMIKMNKMNKMNNENYF